jgi:long-subunit acyl-CoA synthetase (AMP-forming)
MAQGSTIVHVLQRWAAERAETEALRDRDAHGAWVSWTWADYLSEVRRLAKGLIALGHEPGDAVAIMAGNRVQWVFAQLATMAAGGVTAPIYPTSTPAQVAHILKNCAARIAFADQPGNVDKLLGAVDEGASIAHVVTMVPLDHADARVAAYDMVRDLGDGVDDHELDQRIAALDPSATGLLIYTSGTTGEPKGAQLAHEQLTFMGRTMAQAVPEERFREARVVSYLPLSHIAEQLFTNLITLETGGHVTFCGDLKEVKDHLIEAKPNVFLAVPRVWEKFEAVLRGRLAESSGIKAKLASWALRTELAAFEQELATGAPVTSLSRRLANRLVQTKIKSALGLEQLELACSGAAPIGMETLRFFASLGIVIHEGYGMTETTGIATMPPVGAPRFGTVGQALPGVELKIAEDGEIIMKGPNMTRGYLKQPDKTAELIDDLGWLHTGDIGELDGDGFLKITGRKKDLIITAGGKNVAPAEMEAHLKTILGISQAVVIGDRQPYLVALLVLDPEALADLAAAAGASATDVSSLAADNKVHAWLEREVEQRCNTKVARYQTIKKFRIVSGDFTVDGGELTPSLKVRRNIVNDKYADLIASMYAG